MRILIAAIGHTNLRDLSAGPVLLERLRQRAWPAGIMLEDMSYGAVAVLHWFQERPPFDAAVFVGAVARGHAPGTVTRRTALPPADHDDVQASVAEAVTGTIGIDTVLNVVGHFGALPARVRVVEIEPGDDTWGAAFSPAVEAALDTAEAAVADEVTALLARDQTGDVRVPPRNPHQPSHQEELGATHNGARA